MVRSKKESTTKLIKQIKQAAKDADVEFYFVRSDGDHELYRLDGLNLVIPHGRQIKSGTADGLRKRAAMKLGEKWWR